MEESKKHSICINERKEVTIEGITKLESFDKKEFLIVSIKGYIHIIGQNLTLANMDMEKGIISINGSIDVVKYLSSNTNKKEEGFFKKLFK